MWGYAEFLFEKGEYFRAITEYRRLLYFHPDSSFVERSRLRVGQALLRGGEPARAVTYLEHLLEDPRWPRRDEALFLRGLSRLELDRERPYPLREEHVTAGLDDLRAISPRFAGRTQVDGFLQAMDQPPELPQKSPWLAGTLSTLVPGSGSFYVGRYAEGSLAFFVTGLLIYSAVEAFEKEQEGAGWVLGSLALAFHGGAILAAANGAHRFNDHARTAYLDSQRQKFGIVVERGNLAGVFRFSF